MRIENAVLKLNVGDDYVISASWKALIWLQPYSRREDDYYAATTALFC